MFIHRSGANLVLSLLRLGLAALLVFPAAICAEENAQEWIKVDDFEGASLSADWSVEDTRNETIPRIENPQVTKILSEYSNQFLLKKPAADGITGNRKALTFIQLPEQIAPGEIYTFYARINVEYFPNNHIFGLSDMDPKDIVLNDYNALEPSIRITDKHESDGTKNDGTIMVRTGDSYRKIHNYEQKRSARPLKSNTWYEIWMVVNNNPIQEGGQKYDVYVQGADEFSTQKPVFRGADFRMKRERPLIYFLANCNTGPSDQPYGNGGLRYDDLYLSKGTNLTGPKRAKASE